MSFVEIIMIAIGLAMDASAVSLAAACCGFTGNARAMVRMSFHFGLFQAVMPVIGWFVGSRFVEAISRFDHWIAFGVLLVLGVKMIHAGFQPAECRRSGDPSRGWELLVVSVATSIDALAVGLSLAFLDVTIWYPALVIGAVTMIMSVTAMLAGRKLGLLFGRRMEIFGGLALVFVGIRILIEHLATQG